MLKGKEREGEGVKFAQLKSLFAFVERKESEFMKGREKKKKKEI